MLLHLLPNLSPKAQKGTSQTTMPHRWSGLAIGFPVANFMIWQIEPWKNLLRVVFYAGTSHPHREGC